MKREVTVLAVVATLSLPTLAFSSLSRATTASEWYLNGEGTNQAYQIYVYNDDGAPRFAMPVAVPSGNLVNVAWPSAIAIDGERWIFASGDDGHRWNAVYLWRSRGAVVDLPYAAQGAVFTADASEPYGVGPSQVLYEPGEAEPFTMFYLVRGSRGPGPAIAVATSVDGLHWTRHGPVVTADIRVAAGGLSLGYACRMTDGDYALFFSGYSKDLSVATALIATSSSLSGPFSSATIMLAGDRFSTSLDAKAAENVGVVPSGVTLRLGVPHLIADGTQRELVVPIRQDGTRVWFDRRLRYTHVNASIYSMAARKIDPSYARQNPNGSWDGIVTLYDPIPGMLAEYTTEVEAPGLFGPWTYKGTGLRFQPLLDATRFSAENPTPLSEDASCAH